MFCVHVRAFHAEISAGRVIVCKENKILTGKTPSVANLNIKRYKNHSSSRFSHSDASVWCIYDNFAVHQAVYRSSLLRVRWRRVASLRLARCNLSRNQTGKCWLMYLSIFDDKLWRVLLLFLSRLHVSHSVYACVRVASLMLRRSMFYWRHSVDPLRLLQGNVCWCYFLNKTCRVCIKNVFWTRCDFHEFSMKFFKNILNLFSNRIPRF